WEQELFRQHDLNYGTFTGNRVKGKFDVNLAYMGSLELGVKWALNSRFSLYTGVYADYTFNNTNKINTNTFLEYSSTRRDMESFVQNSVLTSQYNNTNVNNRAPRSFVDKMRPVAVGIKVRLGINTCKKDAADQTGITNGNNYCPNTVPDVPVDKEDSSLDTGRNEVPDYLDEYPDTPAEVQGFVDEIGYPKNTDGDGKADYLDKSPKTPEDIAENYDYPEIKESEKQVLKHLQDITFETGKDVIRPESYPILNEVAKIMIDNPYYLLEINGHTDNVGKPEANQILSERRAASVKQYLINICGITASRLTTAGFGDTQPAVPNTTAENKALNRRVEFIVKVEE
ncbi:MAG: OmpA family protein, partial [Bacteroidales bacterium]|nr:OmpA family protein [Bacteroidales bacterium]